MNISYDWLKEICKIHGDTFYLLDSAVFKANYNEMQESFRAIYPNTFIAYSYKTNYIPKLCKMIDLLGGYAEIVSSMEFKLSQKIGVLPEKVFFNGPCKDEETVEAVLVNGGIVNLDSVHDVGLVKAIAEKYPWKNLSIGLRVNFDLGDGKLSRFGFDSEGDCLASLLEALGKFPNIQVAGLHCHFPTRSQQSFAARAEKMLTLVQKHFEDPPSFISLGGGLFGHMNPMLEAQFNTKVPGYADYAKEIASRFKKAYGCSSLKSVPRLIIEPGSALVADTMRFVSKVIDIKEIRGKKIATLTGSIYNINPTLNSKNLPITVYHPTDEGDNRQIYSDVDFAGYTCIESDYLFKGYNGSLEVGDYVLFDNVGSYSVVLKPPFIKPNFPVLEMESNGRDPMVVKREEDFEDIFHTFSF